MQKRKSEYKKIAEKALGRELPLGAIVHHVDLDRKNNRPDNLVILQNRKEHVALHIRFMAPKGQSWGRPAEVSGCKRMHISFTVTPKTAESLEAVRLPGESTGHIIDRAVEALRKGEKI